MLTSIFAWLLMIWGLFGLVLVGILAIGLCFQPVGNRRHDPDQDASDRAAYAALAVVGALCLIVGIIVGTR